MSFSEIQAPAIFIISTLWVLKAFRDDFNDGHSIVIDLVNEDIFEFNGDQYGPILEITAQDEQNPLSIYKGIFTLSNGSSLFVKLEFNFP